MTTSSNLLHFFFLFSFCFFCSAMPCCVLRSAILSTVFVLIFFFYSTEYFILYIFLIAKIIYFILVWFVTRDLKNYITVTKTLSFHFEKKRKKEHKFGAAVLANLYFNVVLPLLTENYILCIFLFLIFNMVKKQNRVPSWSY